MDLILLDHLQKLLEGKKVIMKLRKSSNHAQLEIEEAQNTWYTGKDTLTPIELGYLPKNYLMPKNWFKNASLDRSLKRGYEHCRCNGNLKRGYCRGRSPWQHANKELPNKVTPKPPLNQVIVTWSELLPNHVTLEKYHLTCHVLHHVTPRPFGYHMTLGINHLTYQGIGQPYDHMPLHDHLIKHVSSMHQVRWLARGKPWEQSTVYWAINKVTRL